MDLNLLQQTSSDCTMCPLHEKRTQVVFGEGNPNALLMIVGEGPGADEDRLGRPFVGKAGQLLDKILEAVQISREDIYISNIVKCRPPGNRTPLESEMSQCISILRNQFLLIRPKIIVTLGSAATRALIDPQAKISKIRGQWIERGNVKMIPTFHPAYLLRNPISKKEVWEDFKNIRDAYLKLLGDRHLSEGIQ